MRRVFATTLSGIAFALFATGGAWATDAPEVTGSSVGAQYIAEMPATGDQGVIAQIVAASLLDGSGVSFSVNINGKTFDGGPFRKFALTHFTLVTSYPPHSPTTHQSPQSRPHLSTN
jgi:hypothetical protein